MSQRDGFASGFFTGAIIGGVVGGILGALVASRRDGEPSNDGDGQRNGRSLDGKPSAGKRKTVKLSDSETMEMARRSLEDKIAQLNATIDEVREQLGSVNGNANPTVSDRMSN